MHLGDASGQGEPSWGGSGVECSGGLGACGACRWPPLPRLSDLWLADAGCSFMGCTKSRLEMAPSLLFELHLNQLCG